MAYRGNIWTSLGNKKLLRNWTLAVSALDFPGRTWLSLLFPFFLFFFLPLFLLFFLLFPLFFMILVIFTTKSIFRCFTSFYGPSECAKLILPMKFEIFHQLALIQYNKNSNWEQCKWHLFPAVLCLGCRKSCPSEQYFITLNSTLNAEIRLHSPM